ncbi:hypothetical protein NMG60_11029687 [Bertholletia excelsa]
MGQTGWLMVAIFISLFVIFGGRELKVKHKDNLAVYNHTVATALVEYASAVYWTDLTELITWTCSRCDDLTEGFEMLEIIVDVENCLQGFVGFANNLNAIVIAFRGTQGLRFEDIHAPIIYFFFFFSKKSFGTMFQSVS